MQITGYDPDTGDTLTFASNDIPPEFALDAGSGKITVAPSVDLDFETNDISYSFVVKVRDSNNATDTATVTITVNDVEEAPAIGGAMRVEIDENTVVVGSPNRVSDEPFITRQQVQGTVPSITLSGEDAALINATVPAGTDTVVLTFRSAPDHEAPGDKDENNEYNFDLGADDGVLTTTVRRQVIVRDVIELPTIDQERGSANARVPFEIYENSDAVFTTFTADSNGGGGSVVGN